MKYPISVSLLMLGLFLAAQLAGLGIVSAYFKKEEARWAPLPKIAGVEIERPPPTPFNWVILFLGILIATALLFLLLKFSELLIKLWFFAAVWIALWIALSAFAAPAAAIVLATALTIAKALRLSIVTHNLTELLMYGGLAVLFAPMLTVFTAALLFIALSIYDIIAVLKTKHMIELAKWQAKAAIPLGIVMPYFPKGIAVPTKRAKLKPRAAFLGGGDIALPLLFSAVALPSLGIKTLLCVAGSALGLIFLLATAKPRLFYPALPFLAAGSFLGYGVALIV